MPDNLLENPLFQATAACDAISRRPLGFVDVGARWGTHGVVEPVAAATHVLAFEPDREEYDRLVAARSEAGRWGRFDIAPVALGAQPGTATLHILSAPNNSSLKIPNAAIIERYEMQGFEEVKQVETPTVPLDDVVFNPRYGPCAGEFVKLDTQGSEYEILSGARRMLAERTVAVIAEAPFFEQYKGQKLFSEIEMFMREAGFAFYGFVSLHMRSRKLLNKLHHVGRERLFFIDALFFKDPLGGGFCDAPLSERQAHVLFVCALLLGYYDFALELALATWAEGEEADRIRKLVSSLAEKTPDEARQDVAALMEAVEAAPHLANLEVGRFVDERRYNFNYDDVLQRRV